MPCLFHERRLRLLKRLGFTSETDLSTGLLWQLFVVSHFSQLRQNTPTNPWYVWELRELSERGLATHGVR